MPNTLRSIGFLVALVVMLLIGAAFYSHVHPHALTAMNALHLLTAAGLVFGTVTVTYQVPVAGVTPPTANQAKNTVRGTVQATANGDTTATITHNFGLTTAQLAAARPEITLVPLDITFYASQWIVSAYAANSITLTKINSAGALATPQLGFILRKPSSLGF